MIDYNISFFQYKLKEWELKNNKEKEFDPELELECLIEECYDFIPTGEYPGRSKEDSKILKERAVVNLLKIILDVANYENINLQELLVNHFRNDLKSNI